MLITARFFSLVIPCLLIVMSGCSRIQVRLPDLKSQENGREHRKCIVLLRLVEELDARPHDALSEFGSDGFLLRLANLDSDEDVSTVLLAFSPTEEAKRKGWIYLLLEPGSYYVHVTPPGSSQNPSAKLEPSPGFWLNVPEEDDLIYIGSVSVSCTGRWGVLVRLIDECNSIQVENESDEAREVVKKHFAEYGDMSTILLEPYGKTFPLADKTALFPMGIAGSGRDILTRPDWRTRALRLATGFDGTVEPEKAQSLGGGYPPGALGAGYVMFYLPPAIVFGAIFGEHMHRKWTPCMEALAEEITDMDPSVLLRSAVCERLTEYGIHSVAALSGTTEPVPAGELIEDNFRSILLVEIQRIQIRECAKRGTFCIEMAARVRILDLDKDRILTDRVILYSDRARPDRQFELIVPAQSMCREMSEYCPEHGGEFFREALVESMNAVMSKLFEDLGFESDLQR